MAIPKISMFIIALVWVGFFAAISAPFISNMAINYNTSFDESQIDVYNKLNDLNTQIETDKNTVLDYKEKTGIADLVGDMFNQVFKSLKIMGQSIDIFYNMLFNSFNNSAYNIESIRSLKIAIFTTVLVLIIVGVIVKAITKTDV